MEITYPFLKPIATVSTRISYRAFPFQQNRDCFCIYCLKWKPSAYFQFDHKWRRMRELCQDCRQLVDEGKIAPKFRGDYDRPLDILYSALEYAESDFQQSKAGISSADTEKALELVERMLCAYGRQVKIKELIERKEEEELIWKQGHNLKESGEGGGSSD